MNPRVARRAELLTGLHRQLTALLTLFDGPSGEAADLERAVQLCERAFADFRECAEGADPSENGPAYRRKVQETMRLHSIVLERIRREFEEIGREITTTRRQQGQLPFYRGDPGASCDVRG